jgi:prostaglandin-E synthase
MATPNILWAQRSSYVWLTVQITDARDIKFNLKCDSLIFSCISGESQFEFELNFFKPIVVEESKYLTHRHVDICLKKVDEEEWPRLTAEINKFPWIKVDWSKWEDSDDEKDATPFDMTNMGGFGDFGLPGGLPDFEESDSDDSDELPELHGSDEMKTESGNEKLVEEVNQAS